MKRTEYSFRDLWDNIKHTNIWIIGVTEEKEKKKGHEKILEEIIVENSPNMEKEIFNQVQKAQRIPYRINPRRNTQRHILIELRKIAAKSLQSCLTLCNPIPGILQARTLEWAAISFSNAGKWEVKVKSLSCVRLLATRWTAAHQAPPSLGFFRQECWSGVNCLLLRKTKHKERILKTSREKQQVTYKGNPICFTADHSAETLQAREEWWDIVEVLKGENLHQDYCTWQGSHSKLIEK